MYITDAKCPYFEAGIENFGLIMKGRSLENIDKIYKNFDHGYIMNNFDLEMEKYGKYLEDKKLVHFVNNLFTAHMTKENYKKLNIKNIQMGSNFFFNIKFLRAWWRYKLLNLNVYFMDRQFNNKDSHFNSFFEGRYRLKFPNLGVLAICYTLDVIRPKKLWICGLDFYKEDYVFRRNHQTPLSLQQKKMVDSNLPSTTMKIMSFYKNTEIYLYSYYEQLKNPSNVILLK